MIIKKYSGRNGIAVLVLIVIAAFVLPWRNISWGKFSVQEETVVVSGESKTEKTNEVASFSVGVNVIKEQKQEAIDEVNKKIKEMVEAIKNFGIAEGDIKTQSINVYEQQETDKTKKNQWVVNNTVEITLKDVSKTNELVNLLNNSGANQIYGPNFRIDDTTDTEKGLYDKAISDAKEKAELIAKASGRKLGKVINVVDGSSSNAYPIYKTAMYDGMGGGGSAEPGSTTISKTLTVTFELK
jgi:uncharacterized protein YggE